MPFAQLFLPPTLVLVGSILFSKTVHADTFISEIHYDNAGTDQNEAIEISSDTAADLRSWRLVLYNGSNGRAYNTTSLTAVTADASCGENGGTLVIHYPTNGIQNGAPDGMALVKDGQVVQFLSYEGSLIASDGPAAGMTSSNIGDGETSSTLSNESLQLVDGIWSAPTTNSFGTCTTPVTAGDPPPQANHIFISEFHITAVLMLAKPSN